MDKGGWEKFAGLSEEEVRDSRERHGGNKLEQRKRKSLLRNFLESFGDPMIKILLIALIVNIIFLFHRTGWFESVGIAIAILLATLVSTLSEYGSESAFEKLQEEAGRVNCRVRRGGFLTEIPTEDVVAGDIVVLQAGDRIPADGIILEGRLEVDQSALNGESKEAVKQPGGGEDSGNDGFTNPSLLFSGTIVCAGNGLMRVTKVGGKTVYGRIGREIQEEKRESPLKHRLGELAASIGKFGYISALFTALAYFFNVIVLDNKFNPGMMLNVITSMPVMLGHFVKAATLAVTVVVMAVPEGLPMMITVVLSANMKRMLKDNVLVRKLVGIETAGSMNILFTDKTGTLTRGKLEAAHFVSGSGRIWQNKDIKSIPAPLRAVLHDAIYYNCAAAMSGGKPVGGNATDRAALAFAENLEGSGRHIRTTAVTPFASASKYMSATVAGDWNVILIKGAPEKILPACRGYYGENGTIVRNFKLSGINGIVTELADKAVRVIAVAVSEEPQSAGGEFKNLILVGLLGIRDEIRPEAIEGIRLVKGAGIQTVMITGDSPHTARAIAQEAGLLDGEENLIITSAQMKGMPDKELTEALPRLRVVARALPSDKSRLVNIAQAAGLVAGMTGDGVNDAPALKQADIGFAMGGGTEIAKEAGDIVILDDNFMSIAKAVCYGRTIFKSIRKFIIYQLSICMCAVGVSVMGPLIGVDFPITVIQMLWINIVMDTLAGLAFSGETARKKYMLEPPKPRSEKIINPYMVCQIAVGSIYSAALCLFFLKSPLMRSIFGTRGGVYMMTAFFALFMFLAIFTSFNARTHSINLLDYISANKPFLWIMSVVTVIQILIIYYGGPVFRTAGLEANHLFIIIIIAFTVIPADMLRKYIMSKKIRNTGV